MSVLVWDGRTLSADSQANNGVIKYNINKIEQWEDYVIAGVGSLHDVAAVMEWFKKGKQDPFPTVSLSSCFVVVDDNIGLLRYTNSKFPIAHGFNKCAFGTGSEIAYGALAMGASAEQAVEAAIRYHVDCSGKPQVVWVVME